jgi:hypothetical protein
MMSKEKRLVRFEEHNALDHFPAAEAVSKNSSNASLRFSWACSIVSPRLAISSPGQNDTYPLPSLSIIAVSLLVMLLLGAYSLSQAKQKFVGSSLRS